MILNAKWTLHVLLNKNIYTFVGFSLIIMLREGPEKDLEVRNLAIVGIFMKFHWNKQNNNFKGQIYGRLSHFIL